MRLAHRCLLQNAQFDLGRSCEAIYFTCWSYIVTTVIPGGLFDVFHYFRFSGCSVGLVLGEKCKGCLIGSLVVQGCIRTQTVHASSLYTYTYLCVYKYMYLLIE